MLSAMVNPSERCRHCGGPSKDWRAYMRGLQSKGGRRSSEAKKRAAAGRVPPIQARKEKPEIPSAVQDCKLNDFDLL